MMKDAFHSKRHLLLVDDDDGLLTLMKKTLKREGYSCTSSSSGREMLKILNEENPDLILLDLNLPDMTGARLVHELRTLPNPARFLVITGHGDEKVAVEMMKLGATDYVVKDAQLIDFLPAAVRRALQKIDNEKKLEAAEEALRKENEFTNAILNTTGALVVVLDRDGRIVRFNRACEVLTGYSAREVQGKCVWDHLLPLAERNGFQVMFSKLLAGHFPYEHEHHWVSREKLAHLITWSSTGLRDRCGDVEYVVGTGIDLTERKRLEREVLEISDREQQRIGHDLHDGLCQFLAGIELMSTVLAQKLTSRAEDEADRATRIAQNMREAIRQTRMLARGLSPVVLQEAGLVLALQELAANTEKLFGVQCRLKADKKFEVKEQTLATHLYRIAQEALNNALKHGKANRIMIRLVESKESRSLVIQDNGTGLSKKAPNRQGMGLRIMRFRAGMVGGTLSIRSAAGGGTVVDCTIRKTLEK